MRKHRIRRRRSRIRAGRARIRLLRHRIRALARSGGPRWGLRHEAAGSVDGGDGSVDVSDDGSVSYVDGSVDFGEPGYPTLPGSMSFWPARAKRAALLARSRLFSGQSRLPWFPGIPGIPGIPVFPVFREHPGHCTFGVSLLLLARKEYNKARRAVGLIIRIVRPVGP